MEGYSICYTAVSSIYPHLLIHYLIDRNETYTNRQIKQNNIEQLRSQLLKPTRKPSEGPKKPNNPHICIANQHIEYLSITTVILQRLQVSLAAEIYALCNYISQRCFLQMFIDLHELQNSYKFALNKFNEMVSIIGLTDLKFYTRM